MSILSAIVKTVPYIAYTKSFAINEMILRITKGRSVTGEKRERASRI